jgi:hypothetical protein
MKHGTTALSREVQPASSTAESEKLLEHFRWRARLLAPQELQAPGRESDLEKYAEELAQVSLQDFVEATKNYWDPKHQDYMAS